MSGEKWLRFAMNEAMANLEKHMAEEGAGEWNAVIVTWHPKIEGAWIIVEGRGAEIDSAMETLQKAKNVEAS